MVEFGDYECPFCGRAELASGRCGDTSAIACASYIAGLQPLISIDFETKGSERADVVVPVGSDHGELTQTIARPTRIAVAINDVSEPQWVAIDDGGGGTTIVHFELMPALPQEPTLSA